MPCPKRIECESQVYHLTARGVGRMNIFEDDGDRQEFMRLVAFALKNRGVQLLAWCLMSNHAHLLVHGSLAEVSKAMKASLGRYATVFNSRHGRVGHLFQGRFASTPILDDAQLIATVCYIHSNPARAGISDTDRYSWSSYREYIGAPVLAETAFVLDIMGGTEGFISLHRSEESPEPPPSPSRLRTAFFDEEAKKTAQEMLGGSALGDLAGLPKAERDEKLAALKAAGLSIRQIERLTGIGRNIVHRAASAKAE